MKEKRKRKTLSIKPDEQAPFFVKAVRNYMEGRLSGLALQTVTDKISTEMQ